MREYLLQNGDCIKIMKDMKDNSVDFILTDIPYNCVNRDSNGLREFNKGRADVLTFNLDNFLEYSYRIIMNSICIFCGKEQFSTIYNFFANKNGTVRPIIWEKTNPSPINGQYVYLSGVEMAVWFKKRGGIHLMPIVKIAYFIMRMEQVNCIQQKKITSY